jgi:hypothetical protein
MVPVPKLDPFSQSRLAPVRKIPLRVEALSEFKKLIVRVAKCDYGYKPRWTSPHMLTGIQYALGDLAADDSPSEK